MDPENQTQERPTIGLSIEDQFAEWQEKQRMQTDPKEGTDGSGNGGGTRGGPFVSTFRGMGRAYNEVHGMVDSFGKGVAKMSGLYKVFRDDEAEKEWLQEMEESHQAPFNIADRPGGLWGFYEGVVQFVAPFAAGYGGLAGSRLGPIARGAIAGAAVDFSAFDPFEGNFSNLVEDGPWDLLNVVSNPATQFLAVDQDDSELEARFKNTVDGLFLGATADGLWYGFKAVRARQAARAGTISDEVAAGLIDENMEAAAKAAETARADEPFGVKIDGNGHVEVSMTPEGREMLDIAEAAKGLVDRSLDRRAKDIAFEGADLRGGLDRRVLQDPLMEARKLIDGEAAGLPMKTRAEAERAAAAFNLMAKLNKVTPGEIVLDSADRTRLLNVSERIAAGETTDDAMRVLEGTDFNFMKVSSEDDTKALIEAFSEVLAPAFREVRTHRTQAQLVKEADKLIPGVSGGEILDNLKLTRASLQDAQVKLLAARVMLYGQARRINSISKAVDLDPTNFLAVRQMAEEMDDLANLAVHVSGASSEAGRLLKSLDIDVDDSSLASLKEAANEAAQNPAPAKKPSFAQAIKEKRMSAREISALARGLQLSQGDAFSMLRALRLTAREMPAYQKPGVMERLTSFRASMMLYGVPTQFVNAVSTYLTGVLVPAEIMLGGAGRAVFTGDTTMFRQGLDMLTGPYVDGGYILSQAARTAKQAWKEGRSILDPRFVKDDLGNQRAYHNPEAGFMTRALGVPFRALQTGDEFLKRMSYLSHVRSQSLRNIRQESLDRGIEFRPDEISRRIYDDMVHSVDEGGEATWYNSLQHSRYTTFTNKLHKGTAGHDLQSSANNNAFVKFIVPFVGTPVNIFRFNVQRMPLVGFAQKEMRDMMSEGGEQAAIAMARQASGLAAYSMGLYMAYSGLITGKGPSNPQLRAQKLEAGWQPYSVRTKDGSYISYRRLEPLATPFAIMGDLADTMGEMDEQTTEEVVTALIAASTASITSKTFLIGITEFFSAVGEGEQYKTERFITSFARSWLPAFSRQGNPDPIWRETNSYMESIFADIPGYSETLEARKNIFGEPVVRSARQAINPVTGYMNKAFNPFTFVASGAVDETQLELVELGKAISMPEERIAGGRINLRDREAWINADPDRVGQSPYDRMSEIVQEMGLRKTVERVTKSDQWTRMSPGTELYPGGVKHQIINRLVQKHYDAAFLRVLKEYPDLQRSLQSEQIAEVEALFRGAGN